MDCSCYGAYKEYKTFLKLVIDDRGSYMGCLCYKSHKKKRINHTSVPIMLGSYLDWCIRGEEECLKSRSLWGLVILRGILKIYSSFSTYDSLS